mmetsp:Transcript_19134/g.55240  ORF Transcript_19134/g.55240 Transcript_19134/m.55240 type:complete len:390 (-) Transcript_19134:667-1836(-)
MLLLQTSLWRSSCASATASLPKALLTCALRQSEREKVRTGSACESSPASASPMIMRRKSAKSGLPSPPPVRRKLPSYTEALSLAGEVFGRTCCRMRSTRRAQRSEPTCSASKSAESHLSRPAKAAAVPVLGTATSWKRRESAECRKRSLTTHVSPAVCAPMTVAVSSLATPPIRLADACTSSASASTMADSSELGQRLGVLAPAGAPRGLRSVLLRSTPGTDSFRCSPKGCLAAAAAGWMAKRRLTKTWKRSCTVCEWRSPPSDGAPKLSGPGSRRLLPTDSCDGTRGIDGRDCSAAAACGASPQMAVCTRCTSSCSRGSSRTASRTGRSSQRSSMWSRHLSERSCCSLGAAGSTAAVPSRWTSCSSIAAKARERRPLACGPAQMQSRE